MSRTIVDRLTPTTSDQDRSRYYIRPKKINSPSVRLIAFPYAGAGAVAYYSWAASLSPNIELISLQYPGRGRLADEAARTSVDGLVAEAFVTITTLSEMPFYFFGHSMGAVIAFELVRLLRSNGRSLPRALFVSAREAPQTVSGDLHTLPDDLFLAGLMRYGGMPTEILQSPDMMAYLMPLLRSDMTALETWKYKPGAPLAIPIVALGGDEDKTVGAEQLQRWREFTTSSFECHIMPGQHFYFQKRLPALLSIIHRVIEQTNFSQY